MQLVVTDKTLIAAATVRIRLARADGTPLPPFEPGAHVELGFAGMVRRYSLTGALDDPQRPPYYEICVLRTQPGRGGSAYLHNRLAVGDHVNVDGPFNAFGVDPAAAYSVFIAGGIGITPFLPMMAALDRAAVAYELHYAARHAERLLPLPEVGGRVVRYLNGTGGGTLDVDAVLAQAPQEALIYVCGPRRLIAAVRDHAVTYGWPSERIRYESFGPQPCPDDGPVTVHLALSGLSFEVAPGTPILDALLDHGVWASFECRRGECASCATEVVAGEPDHRDVCLTPEQRRDHMCTCISWARSRELTLNL